MNLFPRAALHKLPCSAHSRRSYDKSSFLCTYRFIGQNFIEGNSLKKSSLKYALKIIAFLTSGHSEKCFRDFETNLKTFQKYKSLLIKSLRGRLLGGQICYSPPFIFPLPISGKKRIFYSKALKAVGVKGFA